MTMSVKYKWRGREVTDAEFRKVSSKAIQGVQNGLDAAGTLVSSTIKRRILKGPKTGRMYGNHQASAGGETPADPGESPASDTGTLVRNIQYKVDALALSVEIWIGTKYAKWLELGTRIMSPRPHLKVSLDENREKIKKLMRFHIRKGLKG